ncbi:aldo/keto reductase [Parafrigoribacterium soli]|uniref:aldo/keto reductase n=1 Tax=Parafrigoribacterium soli TaxID=3144663 RepID=UPI0032EC3D08
MRFRRIGDVTVSAIGLGGMPLSVQGRPDRDRAIATVHAALDAGITLIDTADAYTLDADGQGHNELLIAEALAAYPGDSSAVLIATKGGLIHRDVSPWDRDGSPEHLKRAAEESRERLGVDSIGLYQFHRPDPAVEYRESIEALAALLDDGVIRMAGISNASVEQITLANEVLDGRLASVQNRFSPVYRDSMPELEYCAHHEIAFLPWSPLGGIGKGAEVFASQPAFTEVSDELGISPQRLALAWELALEHVVIPIPGSTRPESIRDSAAAAELVLTAEQLAGFNGEGA